MSRMAASVALVPVLALAIALSATGCVVFQGSGETSSGTEPLVTEVATTPVVVGSGSTPGTPTTVGSASEATASLSQASIDQAAQLGGSAHQGETLFFVIGGSFTSESAAQAALDKARPSFGDMRDYFIVQSSDNLIGMVPGWWVVIEAYRGHPSEESMQFAKRGFPDAYAKKATVRTSDPIPVYEDLVAGP